MRGEGVMARKRIRLVAFLSLLLFFFSWQGQGRDIEIIINFYQALEVLSWPTGGDIWDEPLVVGFNETLTPQTMQIRANDKWGVAVRGILSEPLEGVESLFLMNVNGGECLANPLLIGSDTDSLQEIPTEEGALAVIYSDLEPTTSEGVQLNFYFAQELTEADGPGIYEGTIVYIVALGY